MDFRVNELNQVRASSPTGAVEKEDDGAFQFALKRSGDERVSERVTRLMADITAQGDKISKHMDIRDMRVYRSLISELINEVTTNAYKFSRENYLNRRGLHKVYSMVRVIDKDLDDLAQELLKQEKDNIAILEKTDEIAGLLLDLLA